MASSKVIRSPLPDVELIDSDLLNYLFSNPNKIPDNKPIFIDAATGVTRTYGDVKQRTRSLAHGLRNLGVKPHDVVAFFSPNSIDFGITCYSVIGCGAIVSPINFACTVAEVDGLLETSGARYLIVHSSLLEVAEQVVKRRPNIHMITADGEKDAHGNPTAETLARTSPASALYSIPPKDAISRVALLCFSSGTTGRSKGVQTTHRNLTSNMQQVKGLLPEESTSSFTHVAFLPFFHIYGFTIFMCYSLLIGNTTVVISRFELPLYLRSIQKYKPTTLFAVPPVILLLAKDPSVSTYDLRSVKRVQSAAAPLSAELQVAFEDRFLRDFGVRVDSFQMWGLTETSPFATGTQPHRTDKKRTVGCAGPNIMLRSVNPESMQDVKAGGQGEIWCAGPNITIGYYRNEEANRDGFVIEDDGTRWFRTGDIGVIDDEGYVTIVDRIKEMIKYKGMQVIPSELEGKLLEHPHVLDAGVVGKWIEAQATEYPVGFIVVDAKKAKDVGQNALIKDIDGWLSTRVANHKRLRGGIIVVESIPKTASGKILRRQLEEMLENEKIVAKL